MASGYRCTAMLERANYLWRLSVTGACFALFSVGGSLLTALVFPPLRLLPGGEVGCNRRTQALIQRFFALLIGLLRRLGVMRLELRNVEVLRDCGEMLVFANHPSYLDVVVMSLWPRNSAATFWLTPRAARRLATVRRQSCGVTLRPMPLRSTASLNVSRRRR